MLQPEILPQPNIVPESTEPVETFSLDNMLNEFTEPISDDDLTGNESENSDDDDLTENSDSDDLTENSEVADLMENSFFNEIPEQDFESADFDVHDLEPSTNADFDETESPEMVKLPECFFNDVITESKPNRMLDSFLNFEETKKHLVKEMTPVPPLEKILSKGIATFERHRRNLDEDLEAALKSENEDFLALPKKLNLDSFKLEINAMLNSEAPILASTDEQIQYQKSLEAVKNQKIQVKLDLVQNPKALANQQPKQNPQFFVQDEFADFSNLTENKSETLPVNATNVASIKLDHDYDLKRPGTNIGVSNEASEAKKSKNSTQNLGINSAFKLYTITNMEHFYHYTLVKGEIHYH